MFRDKLRVAFWVPASAFEKYSADTDAQFRLSSALFEWLERKVSPKIRERLLDIQVHADGGHPLVRPSPVAPSGNFPLSELKMRLGYSGEVTRKR